MLDARKRTLGRVTLAALAAILAAVFFGTTSPVLRDTPDLVQDYFKNIAAQGDATISLGEHRVQVFGPIAINTGYYIRKTLQSGQVVESPARFTFVYQLRGGKWMIVEHHSSVLPQPPQS